MKILFFISILLVCLPAIVAALRINEIMYNPAGDDYDFEFLELYSNESIDISNYYFEGIGFVFPENTTIQNYMVVANTCNDSGDMDDFTDFYNLNCSFEYKGILSNSGETITLFSPDGGIVAQVNYSDTAPENYSLELVPNSWMVSNKQGGTPGNENTHPYIDEINDTINETNQTINISVNETNTSINNSINNTSNASDDADFCDALLQIETNKINFSNGEQIKFKHIIENKTDSFEIEYWIDDLFGNTVKSKRITTNTNEKSYTPSIKEKDKVLVIKSRLFVECNDTNLSNNYYEKLIFVVNKDYSEESKETSASGSKQTKKTEKPKISSFYTLTKNFEENKTIKIFSYISNPGPGSEFSVFLNHNNQLVHTQNLVLQDNEIEKLVFEANLKKDDNIFILKLKQNNISIDYKELIIHVNKTAFVKNTSSKIDHKAKERFINNTGLQPTVKKEDINTFKKKNSIAYYIFLGLSVVFNIILIWKR
ncbi:lamin tail domain-containing protein [Candidatus Woesearchaeota archaeon]|nr:lamin tail domain-containing protein [Candidatus Woesearchaeota archaeon]